MAVPINWREWADRFMPTWLRRNVGARFVGAHTILTDLTAHAMHEALYAPWLLEATSPDDALPLIGDERLMPGYEGETPDQYRDRLHKAWTTWTAAGNEAALLAQYAALGLTNVTIKKNSDWNWDGNTAHWSRYWIIIGQPHPWIGEGTWGDGSVWGDGGVWGLDATPGEVAMIRDIAQRFDPGHVLNPWIIVVINPAQWTANPTGKWYDWRERDAGARYIDGHGQAPVILTN